MYDVITVGSATVDVFIDTDSELITIKSSEREEELLVYPAGTKLLINNLNFTIGGGGTNTAVSFSRLGSKVGYIGKLGNDENANLVLKLLSKEKVDFLGSYGKGKTGYSVILDSIEHDRTILTFKGSNNQLEWKELKPSKLKTKWFYFCSMTGNSFKTLEKLALFASKNKINIAYNPSSYQTKKGVRYLSKILKKTKILVLNKEEAEDLAGKGKINFLLKKLKSFGPEIIVITDGKKGSYAYDGSFSYYSVPKRIKVVESTGAGDAFTSSFVFSYMKKKDIEAALKLGQANAEAVIKHYGAKNNLLTKKDLLKRKFNYKIEKIRL